jgi:FkbM family methyltransferase
MKPKELFYLLGFKPEPQVFGYEIKNFELSREGKIQYAQWLHPHENQKTIASESVEELRTFLSAGDVAIDIGAHTGDSTIPIALSVGKTGTVLALEPNPYVFSVLNKNAELNSDKAHIIPLMLAATPNDGEYKFEYSDSGFCNGGLHEGVSKWVHGHAFKLKVKGINLVGYLRKNFADLIPRLKFIKVDAEGYDLTILESISELIVEQKPFLKVEVFKRTNREQRERLYDFVIQHGFQIYRVVNDANYRGELIDRQNLMNWRHYDIFCVPSA